MRTTMMQTNGSNKTEKSERGSKIDKLDNRSDKDNLVYLDDYVDSKYESQANPRDFRVVWLLCLNAFSSLYSD
jgi:hypothetical protein